MIELLVVCSIMIVITGVMLANNNKFGGEVILENLAYDVALSIRQAQIYGIAVERFGAGNFGVGYGMHFSTASPSTYLLFADTEGTGVYDPNASPSQIVETNDLQQGYSIVDLCAQVAGSQKETCGLSSLDILFQRPEPDAYISADGASGLANPAALQQEAEIILESPKGSTSTVVVYAAGQISVQ